MQYEAKMAPLMGLLVKDPQDLRPAMLRGSCLDLLCNNTAWLVRRPLSEPGGGAARDAPFLRLPAVLGVVAIACPAAAGRAVAGLRPGAAAAGPAATAVHSLAAAGGRAATILHLMSRGVSVYLQPGALTAGPLHTPPSEME